MSDNAIDGRAKRRWRLPDSIYLESLLALALSSALTIAAVKASLGACITAGPRSSLSLARNALQATPCVQRRQPKSKTCGGNPVILGRSWQSKLWNCGCSKKHDRAWGRRRMRYLLPGKRFGQAKSAERAASEKLEIIRLVDGSHLPTKRTLDKLGIPRTTFYRWYDRYLSGGPEGLRIEVQSRHRSGTASQSRCARRSRIWP